MNAVTSAATGRTSQLIGLTRAEQRRFSLARLLAAITPGASQRDREAGAFELEACDAVRSALKLNVPGYPLSDELMLGRALTATGGVATGGAVVETEVSEQYWAPALRAQSKCRALGATVIENAPNLTTPVLTAGSAPGAVTENSAPGAESDPTLAVVTYSPNTIRAYTTVSRRLLVSAPMTETVVRFDLIAGIAEAEDLYAIQGSGASGQPTGILDTSGLATVGLGVNGAAPTYAAMSQVVETLSTAKALQGELGWLGSSKAANTLRQLNKVGGYGIVWDDRDIPPFDGEVLGYPACESVNVPSNLTKGSGTNLSAVIFANWMDLFIVEYSPPTILADPYSNSNSGAVRFNVFKEVDIKPRRVASFAAIVDMIAS